MFSKEYLGGLIAIWITLTIMGSLFMWERFADYFMHSTNPDMFERINPENMPIAFDYSVDARHGTGRYNPVF